MKEKLQKIDYIYKADNKFTEFDFEHMEYKMYNVPCVSFMEHTDDGLKGYQSNEFGGEMRTFNSTIQKAYAQWLINEFERTILGANHETM